jgi:hypothetical protein
MRLSACCPCCSLRHTPVTPAAAAAVKYRDDGRCLVEVDGRALLNGGCTVLVDADTGGFTITALDNSLLNLMH